MRGICTGTIISRKSLLTSAHCFNHLKGAKDYSILVSTTSRPFASIMVNPEIQQFETKKFAVYPKYFNYKDFHERIATDVAVVTLEKNEFTNKQKVLPLIFPQAMISLPNIVQSYSVGDSGIKDAENVFRKENFNLIPLDKIKLPDPLNVYTGVSGGFFLVDHPSSRFLPGDSGSSALTNRHGVPTIIGVHSGGYKLGDKLIGFSFVNLNRPEINKWVRTQK